MLAGMLAKHAHCLSANTWTIVGIIIGIVGVYCYCYCYSFVLMTFIPIRILRVTIT